MNNIGEPAQRILHCLRKCEQGMSIEQLCDCLQVTPMAVHRPLMSLKELGFVESTLLRAKKRGRPIRIFRLTEHADDLFPKNYGSFLLQLLDHLGTKKIQSLFESCFRTSFKKNREQMKGKDLSGRVESLSRMLKESNYMAEYQQVAKNQYVIKLLNCPLSKVAKEHPQTCSCEKSYLSKLLQANVQRDHHILSGQNYCSYVVTRK
jgi:predicted ArsR family transcriptional regulator